MKQFFTPSAYLSYNTGKNYESKIIPFCLKWSEKLIWFIVPLIFLLNFNDINWSSIWFKIGGGAMLLIFSFATYIKFSDRLEKYKQSYLKVKLRYSIYPEQGSLKPGYCFYRITDYREPTRTALLNSIAEGDFLVRKRNNECPINSNTIPFEAVNGRGDSDDNFTKQTGRPFSFFHVDKSLILSETPYRYSILRNKLIPA